MFSSIHRYCVKEDAETTEFDEENKADQEEKFNESNKEFQWKRDDAHDTANDGSEKYLKGEERCE